MATESLWGLGLELTTLVGVILSFTLLGRTLGPEGYGGYASLYAVIAPLVTLAASGVTLALLQHAIRDQEPLAETARSCMSLLLLLGSGLTVVGAAVASFVVHGVTNLAIGAILLTEFITTPLMFIASATVQAGANYIGAARIRITFMACRAALIVVLFLAGHLSVTTLGVSQLILSTVLSLLFLRSVGRRFGFRFVPGRVHGAHLRTNAVYSAAISAFALQNDGDKTVLAANKLVVDTGLYSAAYRVVQIGMVPVSGVIDVSHKRFLDQGDGGTGRHLRLALRYGGIMAAYGLVFMVAVLVAAPLLPKVLGDDFADSVTMARWLSPLVLLRTLAMFSLNGLMGLGKTALRTIVIAILAGLTMILYVVAVPIWGWEGAAVGTIVGEVALVVVSWYLLVKHQRLADQQAVPAEPAPSPA
jgi:O-antigen/teichoic acid export membrane protein